MWTIHNNYPLGYDFLSFVKKLGDKYCRKWMDTASKTGTDAGKTSFKRLVQKNTGATGGLIGNKIADKITSVSKTKNKKTRRLKTRNLHTTRKKIANYW